MDKEYTVIEYTLADGKTVNVEVSVSVKEALESCALQEQTQSRSALRQLKKMESDDVST